MTKIIITGKSLENKTKYFVNKTLNGKFSPEIFVATADDLENTISKNPDAFVVYNSDDKNIHIIMKEKDCKKTDFGFNENANFRASDTNKSEDGINFKLNVKGNSVPIWFKGGTEANIEDEIYNVMPAICVGEFLGMNIVEISENLKS